MIQLIQNMKIDKIKGFDELISKSNGVYLVGGIVRDFLLKKDSKDIDVVVCGLENSDIIKILSKYGEVLDIGKSFGVLKYKPNGWNQEYIDIAIPRKDYKIGDGHQGFRIEVDPFLPIELELSRRDFTINSIAISIIDGKVIDPFNGTQDINNKIIKATSSRSFSEDPLRMLRAIQFSSRFKFKICDNTWEMISNNKKDIKLISSERIIEELDKIFFKGDIQLGIDLLISSGIRSELFGKLPFYQIDKGSIKNREEFYFSICRSESNFKDILKGDVKTSKGIKSIQKCFDSLDIDEKIEIRKVIFDAIQISESILDCEILPNHFKNVINEFKLGYLPKFTRDLEIDGNDLINLGLKGQEIGKRQKLLLNKIFEGKLSNKREDLLKWRGI